MYIMLYIILKYCFDVLGVSEKSAVCYHLAAGAKDLLAPCNFQEESPGNGITFDWLMSSKKSWSKTQATHVWDDKS